MKTEYLVIRLYSPMVSWGEIAVGEARNSSNYPSKSAIVGLFGAALGLRRDKADENKHLELAEGYLQSVKLVSSGKLLKDYHTAQPPDSIGKFHYRTRRDEIIHGKDRLGTILSSREYRTDAHALVAIKANENTKWTIKNLKESLLKPKFHLYLGRKSCPLAVPLDPQIISAENFRQALDNYKLKSLIPRWRNKETPGWAKESRWLPDDTITHYYWEGAINEFSPEDDVFRIEAVQQLVRRDQPLSRVRWQFQSRTEFLWLKPNDKKTLETQ